MRAATIMAPMNGHASTAKQVRPDSELGEIMDQFLDDQEPVTVVDGDGNPVGQIAITDALQALRG